MSALPSLESTQDLTLGDLAGPRASKAKIKAAIEAESVWLPKAAAGGHGLRADDFIRFIVGTDKADNETGQLAWRAKDIDARCSITAKKPKAITKLLAEYIDGGLLSEDAVIYPPGRCPQVTFERTPAADSIRIPLGIGWEYRWSKSTPTGPRDGDDTRYVFVWLAAWLLTAEYVEQGITYTSIESYLGLPMPAAWIAEQAGLTARAYRRAWDTTRRVCADADWITWERATREDDGHDAYRITVDFSKAPTLKTIEDTQTPPSSGQGGPPSSGQRDPRVLVTLSSTNPSASILPPHTAATPDATTPANKTNQPKREGGKKEGEVIPFKPKAKAATTDADLSAALEGQAPQTDTGDAYRTWWLTVIAGITAPQNPRRLALDAQAAQSAAEPLKRLYEGGWTPDAASAWLTHSDNSNVVNAWAVLRTRLTNEKTTPTTQPAETTRTTFETKKEREERRASERYEGYRSTDIYYTTLPDGTRILTPM